MENIYWKNTIDTLIRSIWLYTLSYLAISITKVIRAIWSPLSITQIMNSFLEDSNVLELEIGDIIEKIFSLLMLIGYYLFFRSLTRFSRLQTDESDYQNIIKIRTAYLLLILALIISFLPIIGRLICFIIIVISYVKLLNGYSKLKKSLTFSTEARRGASILFSCTIWVIIGTVLGCLPLLGNIIEGIITLLVFFFTVSGWTHIGNGAPMPVADKDQKATQINNQLVGNILIAIYFLHFLSIFHVIPIVVLGLIFIWLLFSPKVQFSDLTIGGLWLLILNIIIYIFIVLIDSRMIGLLMSYHNSIILFRILQVLSNILWLFGVVLFIKGMQVSLGIKTLVYVYSFVSFLYTIIFCWPMLTEFVFGNGDFIHYNMLCVQNFIPFEIIFFILITFFVIKWKGKFSAIV